MADLWPIAMALCSFFIRKPKREQTALRPGKTRPQLAQQTQAEALYGGVTTWLVYIQHALFFITYLHVCHFCHNYDVLEEREDADEALKDRGIEPRREYEQHVASTHLLHIPID